MVASVCIQHAAAASSAAVYMHLVFAQCSLVCVCVYCVSACLCVEKDSNHVYTHEYITRESAIRCISKHVPSTFTLARPSLWHFVRREREGVYARRSFEKYAVR